MALKTECNDTSNKQNYITSNAPCQACSFVDICAEGCYDCEQYRYWVMYPRSLVNTTLDKVPDKISKWL